MKHMISHYLTMMVNSPKVAIGTVSTAVGSHAATVMQWIPTDIGNIATVISVVLSIVLIVSHTIKLINDSRERKAVKQHREKIECRATEKHELEIQVLKEKLKHVSQEGNRRSND